MICFTLKLGHNYWNQCQFTICVNSVGSPISKCSFLLCGHLSWRMQYRRVHALSVSTLAQSCIDWMTICLYTDSQRGQEAKKLHCTTCPKTESLEADFEIPPWGLQASVPEAGTCWDLLWSWNKSRLGISRLQFLTSNRPGAASTSHVMQL